MPEITMPRLSDTMEDGVVSLWLKQVGDTVTRGEILAEIETDKALMELEAYDDGVLEQIIVEAGTRVAIGETIAFVGDGNRRGAAGADTERRRAVSMNHCATTGATRPSRTLATMIPSRIGFSFITRS